MRWAELTDQSPLRCCLDLGERLLFLLFYSGTPSCVTDSRSSSEITGRYRLAVKEVQPMYPCRPISFTMVISGRAVRGSNCGCGRLSIRKCCGLRVQPKVKINSSLHRVQLTKGMVAGMLSLHIEEEEKRIVCLYEPFFYNRCTTALGTYRQ